MRNRKQFMQTITAAYTSYSRIMEKQGFYVVLIVCVLVIVISAAYTFHFREKWALKDGFSEPSPVVINAGVSQDQTISQAENAILSQGALSPLVPTTAPFQFAEPVSGITIRDFSMEQPQLFAHARYWRVHPGIDLMADYGTIVRASAPGKVIEVREDGELGLLVRIAHEHGFEAIYAGLSDASYVKAGDPVSQGQTIGHAGNGVLAEADAEPHLHFEVWRNGSAVDPVKLFLGIVVP